MRPIDPAYEDPAGIIFWRRAAVTAYVVTGLVYLAWRTTVFSQDAPKVAALFYAVEAIGFVSTLLLFFVTGQKRRRQPITAAAGLSVDVFIPTYNEEVAVVRRTVVAALRMRYPHETWLLDDGNRPEVAALAKELGCHYLARTKNTGAKAGNLNNALLHAKGDFVALFDADHCPEPIFLDRLLGYFDDAKVAFVQTPQDYYNLGSFQHGGRRDASLIWHEQSGFHHVEQSGRDRHNAATLCGCSCVLRRRHLDLIGGFPEDTVTEDMHAAVKLQKLGLSAVYHDEPLAYGVAAPDLPAFAKQRLRWGEGNMQVCRAERVPFARGLTWRQNLCYMLLSTVYVDAWRKLILYLAPPLTIMSQIPPVEGKPSHFFLFFVPYFLSGVAAYYAHYGSFARIIATEVYSLARLTSGLLATWGLVRRRIPFRVSSKQLLGRMPVLLILPACVILILSLWVVGAVGLRAIQGADRPQMWIPIGIECGLALLCAYHAALALRVLKIAYLSSRVSEANYEHPISLPVVLNVDGSPALIVWTKRISIDRLMLPETVSLPPGHSWPCTLVLPGKTLNCTAEIRHPSRASGAALDINWRDKRTQDDLDQLLHAGRWHRLLAGRSELVRRWWQRPPLRREPVENARNWQPAVVETATRQLALTYLCGDATGTVTEAVVFGGLAPGPLRVVSTLNGQFDGQTLVIGEAATGYIAEEGALESVGGRRLLAEIQHRVAGQVVPLRPLQGTRAVGLSRPRRVS